MPHRARCDVLLKYTQLETVSKSIDMPGTFYKHFPVDMHKSILLLAIHGRLVEQWPEKGKREQGRRMKISHEHFNFGKKVKCFLLT